MSDDAKELPPWAKAMQSAESRFKKIAANTGLNWDEQAGYIRNAIEADTKLQDCTPKSIVSAIVNIAATGVSISPMSQYAFLQPQGVNLGDKKNPNWITEMRLKISYLGHIDALTSTGAVRWIRADVVREGDTFKYNGPFALPDISVDDPFADDRREVRGGYAVAELPNGVHYCEIMRNEEIAEVQKASKSEKYGPWTSEFRTEMIKKSAINRLRKTIPKNANNRSQIDALVSVENADYEFNQTAQPTYEQSDLEQFTSAMYGNDAAQIYHLSRVHRGQVWVDLVGTHLDTAPKGKKTLFRQAITELEDAGRIEIQNAAIDLAHSMENNDESGAMEILTDYEPQRSSLDEQIKGDLIDWVGELEKNAAA